jgi:hypothetical protein
MAVDAKERTQPGSRKKSDRHRGELGLHNLSSLRRACEKTAVRVEISQSQSPRRDLTKIDLAFQL